MVETLQHLDATLMLWLNGFHNSFGDILMMLITNKWAWVPMYVMLLYVLIEKWGASKTLLFVVLMFTINFALSDYTCGTLIRDHVCRPRPSDLRSPIYHLTHIVEGTHNGYGFPSCHGANSFALATLIALYFRKRKLSLFIFIWAAIHSYSRIYIGVHYLGDILVGATIGAIQALIVYYAFNYFLHFKKDEQFKHADFIYHIGIAIFMVLIVTSFVRWCIM